MIQNHSTHEVQADLMLDWRVIFKMAAHFTQAGSCSWKLILLSVIVIQLLIFGIFQKGFFLSSPRIKASNFKHVAYTLPPEVSWLDESQWAFEVIQNLYNNTFLSSKSSNLSVIVSENLIQFNFAHDSQISEQLTTKLEDSRVRENSVAIGLAITSHKSTWDTIHSVRSSFPFFNTLLPSFCETASYNYSYAFFLAFDKSDKFFTDLHHLEMFQSIFYEYIRLMCHPYSEYNLHFVQCSHNRHPAWAQSDAMMAAYMAGSQYFYRVNDDSQMKTQHWTDAFIKTLASFDPPNVGVVGPTHKGGNLGILTYDFVHYNHIEIHGIYYPRLFTDWHADRWITDTYKPGRCIKLRYVHLLHTLEKGQRYAQRRKAKSAVRDVITNSKTLIDKFVTSQKSDGDVIANERNVISMSLFGRNPVYTYGAVRNLQLHRIYLRDWSVRVYVLAPHAAAEAAPQLAVPLPVLRKLAALGAQLVFLNASWAAVEPRLWRYLVADDPDVDRFLLRDAHARLGDVYAALVHDWVRTNAPFFCAREPVDAAAPVRPGLSGASAASWRQALGQSVQHLLLHSGDQQIQHNQNTANLKSSQQSNILLNRQQLIYEARAKCYDQFHQYRYNNSIPFPFQHNRNTTSLETKYNQFDVKIT